MTLFLVRHGRAKDEHEDPQRPLTDRGFDEVTRVARHAFDRFDVRAARVFHSGKTRARQTAEIWGDILGAEVTAAGGLAPNDDVSTWVERLNREAADLVVVGHLPPPRPAVEFIGHGKRRRVGRHLPRRRSGQRTDDRWAVSAAMPPELA